MRELVIDAQLVKTLREKTSAGLMDCKRALAETHGDLEAAVDLLRKKGAASAAKKADREAKEGDAIFTEFISDQKMEKRRENLARAMLKEILEGN